QQLWTQLIGPTYSSAELKKAWYRAQQHRGAGLPARPKLDTPLQQFKKKFHITYLPPRPSENKAKLRFDTDFIRYQRGKSSGTDDIYEPIGPDEIVMWFDLTWPTKQQLANAKKVLLDHQVKVKFRSDPVVFNVTCVC